MEHRLATLVAQPGARHPAGRHVDHAQRVQELAGATPAAVGDQVHLEEPGSHIGPFGKGANRNLALQQRAGRSEQRNPLMGDFPGHLSWVTLFVPGRAG